MLTPQRKMCSAVLTVSCNLSMGCEVEFAYSPQLKRSHSDSIGSDNDNFCRDKKFKCDEETDAVTVPTIDCREISLSKYDTDEMNPIDTRSYGQQNETEHNQVQLTKSKSDPVSNLLGDYPYVNNFPDLNVVHEDADDGSQDHDHEVDNSVSQENSEVEEPLGVEDVSSSTLCPSESEQCFSSRVSSELETIFYSDRTSSEYIPMLNKHMRVYTPVSFWDAEL